jgi:hypothetical protein
VAAPALTANSPSAGFISWTAFNIQYLGVSYAISAGNTNKKFTYWLFNNGAGGPLQSSDTLPSTLTDDDLLLFLNRTGIPVNAQAADVLYGDLMVPGSILTTALGAHVVTADKISVGQQTASVFANANFEDVDTSGALVGWGTWWQTTGSTLTPETASPISGSISARMFIPNGAGNNNRVAPPLSFQSQVTPGTKWYLSIKYRASRASTNAPTLTFHTSTPASNPTNIFDANATWQNVSGTAPADSTTVYQIQGTFTVPAGHTKMTGSIAWTQENTGDMTLVLDEFMAYPATTDNQITEISPGKIVTGLMQGSSRVVAGASLTGARAELNGSVGLQAFNSAGTETWRVNSSDGGMYVGGVTGLRIQMTVANNPFESNQAWSLIQFFTPDAGWDPATFWANYIPGSPNSGYFSIVGPVPHGATSAPPRIILKSTDIGDRELGIVADTLNFTSKTMILDAAGTASFDVNLAGTSAFAIKDSIGQNFGIDFAVNSGYITLRSRTSANARKNMWLTFSDLVLDSRASGQVVVSAGVNTNRPIMFNSTQNAAIHFTASDHIRISNLAGDGWMPIQASAFNVNSDERKKKNLERVTGALGALRALDVYDYDLSEADGGQHRKTSWHGSKHRPHPRMRGVMAQQVAQLLPDLVQDNDHDDAGPVVELYGLLSTVIAGMQEMAAELDSLKASK